MLRARSAGASPAGSGIRCVGAPAQVAALVGLEAGTPLLKLDRVHYSLDRVPLEWRIGYCELTSIKYVSRVSIDAG